MVAELNHATVQQFFLGPNLVEAWKTDTFLYLIPENNLCTELLLIFGLPPPENNHLKINSNISGDILDQNLDAIWISVILK